MSPRTLTTSTIDSSLKLLRWPADLMVGLLPGNRTGLRPAAQLIVDRVDAAIRAGMASTLGDDTLRADARRRQEAAAERERALDLRHEAQQRSQQAETRLEDRNQQATRRRERASAKAGERRRQAAGKQRTRTRRAAEDEQRRTEANLDQEVASAQRIESQTAEARLPAVEEQAQALREREAAADQSDEARRLGEAAARVKRERKQSNGV